MSAKISKSLTPSPHLGAYVIFERPHMGIKQIRGQGVYFKETILDATVEIRGWILKLQLGKMKEAFDIVSP